MEQAGSLSSKSGELPQELDEYDTTLQNFIYKHTIDLENVQRNKKKENGVGFAQMAQMANLIWRTML